MLYYCAVSVTHKSKMRTQVYKSREFYGGTFFFQYSRSVIINQSSVYNWHMGANTVDCGTNHDQHVGTTQVHSSDFTKSFYCAIKPGVPTKGKTKDIRS